MHVRQSVKRKVYNAKENVVVKSKYHLTSAYAQLSMTQSVEQMDKLTAIPVEQVVVKLL